MNLLKSIHDRIKKPQILYLCKNCKRVHKMNFGICECDVEWLRSLKDIGIPVISGFSSQSKGKRLEVRDIKL